MNTRDIILLGMLQNDIWQMLVSKKVYIFYGFITVPLFWGAHPVIQSQQVQLQWTPSIKNWKLQSKVS